MRAFAATLVLLAVCCCGAAPCSAQGDRPRDGNPADWITKETREAIDGGLAYLAKQQADDGAWGTRIYKRSVGVTSLAGLAFLSAGHRPGKGTHGPAVAKAIDYVLQSGEKQIRPIPPGFFRNPASSFTGAMYEHGYAVWLLAEAHAVLAGEKKQKVKDALIRGVQIILDAQNKEGGWRYMPQPRDADLSVTACVLHALFAAQKAGIEVPEDVLDRAVRYVRSCHAGKELNFRYQPQGSKGIAPFALCAVAVSALAVGDAGEDEPFTKGLAYLRAQQPNRTHRDASDHMYFCYGNFFAALAMKHVGGKDWQAWYPAVRDALLNSKRKPGPDAGWPEPMCRHMNTALAVLTLQLPDSRLAIAKR